MRSARALQEAFNLRSTVAVLGFAVRSLGQMLEDGQLDALIEQQRNQPPVVGGVMAVVAMVAVMVVVVVAVLMTSVAAVVHVRTLCSPCQAPARSPG